MSSDTSQDINYEKGLTFEKVWASIQESRRENKASMQKLRDELKKSSEETDRKIQDTARQMKETDKRMGYLDNRFGELVEHLVAPSIKEKFNELGFNIDVCSQNIDIREAGNPNVFTEIDILLENGDIVIAIEVKSKPKKTDVIEHTRRMEILRKKADQRHDTRRFQGAIAGAIMKKNMRDYILQMGFYAIEQTGDTVRIIKPDPITCHNWSGKAREW